MSLAVRRSLSAGDTFGKYRIVRLIGAGGMASVFEALHEDLHKRVALKVLHPNLAMRIDVVQRFKLEARAASRFSHPSVVDISDIGAIDGIPFMAMDLLEGESLAEVADREGLLSPERLVDVMLPVISAVAAAHEAGVLHRDLKPGNIFLRKGRRREQPMLLDFGISKVVSGTPMPKLTTPGELLGTPPYMSPEQVLHGMDAFSPRSDQYALGVVLYECSTGRLPFADFSGVEALLRAITDGLVRPPSSINEGLPPAFDALIARAMSLAPADRFHSVVDLGMALLPFAGERARALWIDEFGPPEAPREPVRPPPVIVPAAELRAIPLLADLPADELARLPDVAPAQRFPEKSALFDQGAPGGTCFLLVSGSVDVSRTHGADTWDVAAVGPGALLGLPSLWDPVPVPRPVAALALIDCVAIPISRPLLDRLGTECPSLADLLHAEAARISVRRLRLAGNLVTEAERSHAEAPRESLVRLAAALAEWSVPMPRKGR